MSSWTKSAGGSMVRKLGSGASFSPDNEGESRLVGALTDHAAAFLFVYSPPAKALLSWSDNGAAVLGVKDIAIARDGNLFLRHVHPDDRFLLFSDLERALEGKTDYRATYRWIRPDTNEVRWLHCRGGIVDRDGEKLFEGLILDLTAEFTGSVGMLAGPDSVGTVLAALPTMVFTVDRDLRLLRINRPAETAPTFNFGDPKFQPERFSVGKPILEAFGDRGERARYEEICGDILEGRIPRFTTRIGEGAGATALEIAPLIESAAVDGLLFVVSDISTTVSLEQRLAELQRSEGLRTLAAGVVHNFNNALQRIIGQAALLTNHSHEPEVIERAGRTIIEIIGRTSDLTRQLFVFDEGAAGAPVPVDLNVAAMAAVNRIKDLFTSGVKVSVAFGSIGSIIGRTEPMIEAIEAIIRAVRGSICGEGVLSIKTFESAAPLTEGSTPTHVSLVVSAAPLSGTGAAPNRSDPLSLDGAAAPFRESGGGVSAVRDAAGGCTVTAAAPLARIESGGAHRIEAGGPLPHHSAPTILIVDDDLMVLETVCAILNDLGFQTIAAPDPNEALEILRTYADSLEVVLLDALMPGIDGITLLRRMKRAYPDIKVIGFSGAPDHVTQGLLKAGAETVLRKPVDPTTLCQAVRAVIAPQKAA